MKLNLIILGILVISLANAQIDLNSIELISEDICDGLVEFKTISNNGSQVLVDEIEISLDNVRIESMPSLDLSRKVYSINAGNLTGERLEIKVSQGGKEVKKEFNVSMNSCISANYTKSKMDGFMRILSENENVFISILFIIVMLMIISYLLWRSK